VTGAVDAVVTGGGLTVGARRYDLGDGGHDAWLDLHEALARDLGLRRPLSREAPPPRPADPHLTAVLTAPVSPTIPYGYGDPCVVAVGPEDYRLLVTSNDAPDAFPILASRDLVHWGHTGFVFPQGTAPAWALTGPDSDFWAPEMHRVGDEWRVCFTAREHDGGLAIGLARASSPDGPFTPDPAPIVRGGVIDSHLLVDAEGAAWLVWKKDDNDVWPPLLARLLHQTPEAIAALFSTEADRRTAAFAASLAPWLEGRPSMERFFALQTLIEAVAEDLPGFALRLEGLKLAEVPAILQALRTRIFIQPLAPDGRRLVGAPKVILQNDLPWEGHLIEGVWIVAAEGRYWLFYAGNDFSTARYGVGVAVAGAPDEPYVKSPEAFLTSGRDWWGPGHPSVVRAPDGWRMFLHAFAPGKAGYKRFRALLSAPIRFGADGVRLGQ
jgi:hypothetical protein